MSDDQTKPAITQREMTPAEKAKAEAGYKEELEKLGNMQEATNAEAHQIAQESIAVMMALGWTWDAALIEIKDNETGKPVRYKAELIIRPLRLGEWQSVQKEKLRHELSGGKSSGIIA